MVLLFFYCFKEIFLATINKKNSNTWKRCWFFLFFASLEIKKNFPTFYRISLASNQEWEIKAMNMEQNSLRNRYDACLIPNIYLMKDACHKLFNPFQDLFHQISSFLPLSFLFCLWNVFKKFMPWLVFFIWNANRDSIVSKISH